MTGNAADPDIDPFSLIPEVITVGPAGAVTLTVPRNVSPTGTEHAKGFLVYAEALPTANLGVSNQSGVIPADPTNFPAFFRRLNDIPVISADSFRVTVNTSQTDALDPNTDDNAIFKIDQGTQDFNGNGSPDIPLGAALFGGYEQFVTINQPTFGSGGTTGVYSQEIDATTLSEGFHYLSALVFRHRPDFTSALFTEKREVFYIDRLDPVLEVPGVDDPIEDGATEFRFINPDKTVTALHTFFDLPDGQDPVALADPFNAAARWDRLEWRSTPDTPLADGAHTLTVVTFEHSGRASVFEYDITVGSCPADLAEPFGTLDFSDVVAFLGAFSTMDPAADLAPPFGTFDFSDVVAFLAAFGAGCP